MVEIKTNTAQIGALLNAFDPNNNNNNNNSKMSQTQRSSLAVRIEDKVFSFVLAYVSYYIRVHPDTNAKQHSAR